jgi:predicted signal transduction protein with EAL and GGDEF domain
MYHAKNQGRNTFQFFTPEFNHWVTERLRIENGLRHALARNELRLHFQPQVSLATRRIVGCEALLRWQPAEESS